MRTKFWENKAKKESKPRVKKESKIDVSKLTPSQKQALAAALMEE